MKLLLCIVLLATISVNGQVTMDWREDLELKLSDFASPNTEINPELDKYSIHAGVSLAMAYNMTGMEYALKRNLNKVVNAIFDPESAYIIAPTDTLAQQLLAFANLQFDLAELYARKIRKDIFEQKKFFSKNELIREVFNKKSKEFNVINAQLANRLELGINSELTQQEHLRIQKEIEALDAFCFQCNPSTTKQ